MAYVAHNYTRDYKNFDPSTFIIIFCLLTAIKWTDSMHFIPLQTVYHATDSAANCSLTSILPGSEVQ